MTLKKHAKNGIIWTALQQGSVQLINFAVQITLAKILTPEDFGTIALILIFNTIGINLIDGGMTTSLIRNKDNTELDYSTVFFANVGISVILYLFLFICAPLVEMFFEIDNLTQIVRVYSISFVLASFTNVQVAKYNKELNFRTPFLLQLPSVVLSASLGLGLAFNGWGVWSLVFLNVAQPFFYAIFIWIFSPWKPNLVFDKAKFNYHFSFGYKMTISSLLNSIYNNMYRVLIGKFYSPINVGYFHQADSLRTFPVNQLSNVLNKVTFPLFADIDNDLKLKSVYKRVMNLVLFVTSALMVYLIICAFPLFDLFLGPKWYNSIYYFQVLCLASIMLPLGTYNLNILKVKGRSDLYLRLEIIKKTIGLTALLVSVQFSIIAVVWCLCLTNIFFAYLNSYFSGRLIGYSFLEQFRDSISSVFYPILAGLFIYLIKGYINLKGSIMEIVFLLIIYLLVLFILIYIFKRSIFLQLK